LDVPAPEMKADWLGFRVTGFGCRVLSSEYYNPGTPANNASGPLSPPGHAPSICEVNTRRVGGCAAGTNPARAGYAGFPTRHHSVLPSRSPLLWSSLALCR